MDMRSMAVVLVLAVLVVGGQGVAAAQAPLCPPPMPVSEVATQSAGAGLAATGWTVSRGIDPQPFDVTVLGVLANGIAPGMDMIIVEARSLPAPAGVTGIWAGMSGSPVYEGGAPGGRLIGAVAYGLAAGPSMIGGLTAAEDMYRLRELPATAPTSTIPLSPTLQQEVAATGAASASEAAAGLQRLPLPLSVSGLRAGRLPAFASVLGGRFAPYSGGTASAAAGNPEEIIPGSNFAAALSYGDVTAAGVGTTTALCGDHAIAFGHPMMFQGPTALSTHTASAITIQDDPTFVPFKIANVGGPVGRLDQDRLAGIRALIGVDAAPAPIQVLSNVTEAGGNERRGTMTSVNRTADVPGIAFGHLLGNIDRVLDRIGEGSSSVGWTVTGTAGGERFSLSRSNRFADAADVSLASSVELLDQLGALARNEFTAVTFDGLGIDAALEAFRRYRITGIERHTGAAWVRVDPAVPVPASPGATIRLRVLLAAHRSDAPIAPVELSFTIPHDAGGSEGALDVRGGSASLEEGGLPGGPGPIEAPGAAVKPASFKELLTSLQDAPRGDDVVAELRLFGASPAALPPVASVRRRVAEVVTGRIGIVVRVEGGESPFGEFPFDDSFSEFPEFEEEDEEFRRPRARLALGGPSTQKLATALKRGVRITVRTNARGRLALRALLSRRAARRLELEQRVVGSLTRRVGVGPTAVKLKLRRGARERLKDAGRVKLTIDARFTSSAGIVRTDRFAVVLKRRAG
jgi:hypothetical protein